MINEIKAIAAEHDDIELFKLACELEKEAGALQMAGQQIVDYTHKKGLHGLGTFLNKDVGDVFRREATSAVSAAKPIVSSAANSLKSAVKPAASAGKQYAWGDKVIDEQTYNRLPIGGMARDRFKPM